MHKRYGKPFRFKPKHPEKYVGDVSRITMRSTWEKKFAIWCDLNPSVLKWNSEGVAVPYYHQIDGRMKNYYIDFFVLLKQADGNTVKLAVEVKPHYETQPPVPPKRKTDKSQRRYLQECVTYQQNCDKWRYARQWADDNGFKFVIMTENELGI